MVVGVLLNNMDTATAFFWCSVMLGCGFVASVALNATAKASGKQLETEGGALMEDGAL